MRTLLKNLCGYTSRQGKNPASTPGFLPGMSTPSLYCSANFPAYLWHNLWGVKCDNIHSWISTTGDLAFSHQQEFTVLNSQKGFGDLFLRSHSFLSFLSFTKLKHPKIPTFRINALSLCIRMAQCLARSQTFSQFIRPISLLSYTSKSKTDCVFKYYLESNEQQRIECNASSFKVLGAIGTRSFGKPCKCIHKSQLSSWKLTLDQSFDLITSTNERSSK